MDFFNDENIEEDNRRDVAFQAIVAMRDTISIATRAQQPPTYEQSLRMYNDLDPEIYESFDNLLSEKNENDTVKYYKEEARLQSKIQNRKIEAAELIEQEIDRLKELKTNAEAEKRDTKFIDRKVSQLYSGLENLKPRSFSEHTILTRDVFNIDRDFCGEKFFTDYKFIDFKLPRNRFLRIRLLHPDLPEHITGADLIYEQINIETKEIRFVFLQYKTWNDGAIYFSQQKNLIPQLRKLQQTLCNGGFCSHPSKEEVSYRFPYCCGFLRPTDKLQHRNSKMVSSGLHIPVCDVLKAYDLDANNGLFKGSLKNYCISHKIFEEMFNLNLLGSRWMPIAEIEDFYKSTSIIEPSDTIKLHAKEIVSSKYFEEMEDH